MNDFPYPITITIVQLLTTILYLKPFFRIFKIPYAKNRLLISKNTFFTFICPLALGKFISTACAHFSIWKVSISYAHTVKATMPLFTIFLTRIIMKEKQTTQVYLSLVPIVFGVLLASVTELSYDSLGLMYALLSTLVFALMNIFSKKLLSEKKIHHLSLLHILSSVAVVIFLPFWFYVDFKLLYNDRFHILNHENFYKILLYLFLNSTCNFGQNIMAFTLLSMIAPLSYSVANVAKRIWVISLSLFFMGNKTSIPNVIGMAAAIFGIFLYHRAKYQSRLRDASSHLANGDLPFHNDAALMDANKNCSINGNLLFETDARIRGAELEKYQLTSVLSQGYLSEV
ncbi:unnamed protein product [Gordionus sp. m RMFG-2023]